MRFREQALRFNSGKAKWSLVDFESFLPLVEVLEFGARKYEVDNWKKGLPVKAVCESMLRHVFAFMNGEDLDPESGLSHVGHIQANAMFLAFMLRERREAFDDRVGAGDAK